MPAQERRCLRPLVALRFLVQLWENKELARGPLRKHKNSDSLAVRIGAGNISGDYGILSSEGMIRI
jgi:hypothetical protein